VDVDANTTSGSLSTLARTSMLELSAVTVRVSWFPLVCHNHRADVSAWNLHQTMAEWFDQQDYIERYSPFGKLSL
jgi:hypothetical protein